MVLQPRKFKYKVRHKIRKHSFRKLNFKPNFGQAGLFLLQPLRLNSKKIFRLKLFLKKAARRADETRRKI